MPKRCPNGSPKGNQNPSKIIKKSSLSRRGLPQATCDLPEGPPQKSEENPEFCTIFGRNFGRVQLLIVRPKLKKNGGRSVLYLLLWGERLRRQSTGYSLSLQNSKKNGGRSVLYFLLWGERLRRQSTGFVMTPCLTPRKKNVPNTQKKAGVPPCPLYFLGCRKSGRVQAGSQRRRRSLDLEIPRHGGGLALAPLDIYRYIERERDR